MIINEMKMRVRFRKVLPKTSRASFFSNSRQKNRKKVAKNGRVFEKSDLNQTIILISLPSKEVPV